MRLAGTGAILLGAGTVAAVALGVPPERLTGIAGRVAPILLFVVAITVVAELAAEAGLFRRLAELAGRFGRGSALLLWVLVAILAAASTVFLSLDTAAVLLTPVVVLLARHAGLSPIPFALTTVWLANTASLLLPVSNLTNLLAVGRLGLDAGGFAALLGPSWLAAVLVPLAVVLIIYRRTLLSRYPAEPAHPVADRALLAISAVLVAALVPLLVSGLPVEWVATGAAVLLLAVFAVRRRSALTVRLVPWQLLLFAAGLFLVVEVAHAAALTTVLDGLGGTDDGAPWRLAAAGAVGANAVDNLPAYLLLEPAAAGDPVLLAALLVGVNAGPLVTPWASLATLLWHDRLRSLGVEISWLRYAALGLLVAPLTVAAATLALVLTA